MIRAVVVVVMWVALVTLGIAFRRECAIQTAETIRLETALGARAQIPVATATVWPRQEVLDTAMAASSQLRTEAPSRLRRLAPSRSSTTRCRRARRRLLGDRRCAPARALPRARRARRGRRRQLRDRLLERSGLAPVEPGRLPDRGRYRGGNGYSLRLAGLEPGVNDLAMERRIVMHGASYVSDRAVSTLGRLGRSLGLSPRCRRACSRRMIDQHQAAAAPSFAYYPDQRWIKRSRFVQLQRYVRVAHSAERCAILVAILVTLSAACDGSDRTLPRLQIPQLEQARESVRGGIGKRYEDHGACRRKATDAKTIVACMDDRGLRLRRAQRRDAAMECWRPSATGTSRSRCPPRAVLLAPVGWTITRARARRAARRRGAGTRRSGCRGAPRCDETARQLRPRGRSAPGCDGAPRARDGAARCRATTAGGVIVRASGSSSAASVRSSRRGTGARAERGHDPAAGLERERAVLRHHCRPTARHERDATKRSAARRREARPSDRRCRSVELETEARAIPRAASSRRG